MAPPNILCCAKFMEDDEENVKNVRANNNYKDDTSKTKCCFLYWLLVLLFAIGVITVAALTISRYVDFLKRTRGSHHHPQQVVPKYSKALQIAMQFFDVQKWDLMKFGFPMAFTATVLSWAILEYGHHMNAVQQLKPAQDSLKWVTDYLLNSHPSPNVLYVQVGDPELDHNCWERPETMTVKRPVTQINASFPGTEVAAETAAAMASASLVFKKINSTYSDMLLTHAQQLFTFADTYRGLYSINVPQVQKYYNSTAYGDELLWAASWLYLATGDRSYLRYVTDLNGQAFADWGNPTWFSWDDKRAGVHVLLSRINLIGVKDVSETENLELQMYRKTAETIMCGLLPDSPTATASRTKGGLIWIAPWNCLQHSVASAFLALLYSDYMLTSGTETLYCSGKLYKPDDLRDFSISQVEYVLGNNPMKLSYLVGYGSSYPLHVHHRGSSIPANADTGCKDGFKWLDSESPNPNVAVGALVGGPFFNESYVDARNNTMQGEPTTYNSALLVGLLSGLATSSTVAKSFTT
ncbi:hypothetical protein EZV62_014353 [Acer yangbiense]|uniref:Endoglucanase n=1 Tax=Acer yangbiense TaxID=1000413 RepID=A0A5C7HS14_9ROSI|nr:hypothetical protein EZV62_014353 [Acer yangbiense]